MDADEIEELGKLLSALKRILYGTSNSEPNLDACAKATEEFYKGNGLRPLIESLPELDLEARKDATRVVVYLFLQRQQEACDYLLANTDLLDALVLGYETHKLGLHYGIILREFIRHQSILKYVLESHWQKLFGYLHLPHFDISSDAAATLKELLTRHKPIVAAFLSKNYDRFFREFNTKLLGSPVYIARRQAIELLADILLDGSDASIMMRYVSSRENLIVIMELLRDPSERIQLKAFFIFKLFAVNLNKPIDIIAILIANRRKLLRFFGDFKVEEEDKLFEADKAEVVKAIAKLKLGGFDRWRE